jgi:acetate kinase
LFSLETTSEDSQFTSFRTVIIAHLGNGSSMCACKAGESVDTTMSFTPNAGLLMATRTGDLDPGVFTYLNQTGSRCGCFDIFGQMLTHTCFQQRE